MGDECIKKEDAIQSIIAHDLVGGDARGWAEYLLENAPTIDAVPVVRCKNCFMYGECKLAKFIGDNGYCSCGKEKR